MSVGTAYYYTTYRIKHTADTEGGESGAPIVSTAGHVVYGIHTHGTTTSDPYNKGSAITDYLYDLIDYVK